MKGMLTMNPTSSSLMRAKLVLEGISKKSLQKMMMLIKITCKVIRCIMPKNGTRQMSQVLMAMLWRLLPKLQQISKQFRASKAINLRIPTPDGLKPPTIS